MSVLVVDASAAIRARLRELLTDSGVGRVLEAERADAAVGILRAEPVSVVIFDLVTPAHDGLQRVAEMRRARPTVLLIVLSHDASERHRRACAARGADVLLDKSREFERAVALTVERAGASHPR